MQLTILGSSSSGNSALVEVLDKKILIDVGFSFKRIKEMLAAVGTAPEEIDAVILTHEHSDHVMGLSGFSALRTPVYATGGTAISITGLKKPINWRKVPQQAEIDLDGIVVRTFPIPHDAMEPIGLSICAFGKQLTWALDMGHLTDTAKRELVSANIMVLESNYDDKLLQEARRPFSLKQRIKGRHGHLSNEDAYNFLINERSSSWEEIYLAHLSNECNDVAALQNRYAGTGLGVEVIDPKAIVAFA